VAAWRLEGHEDRFDGFPRTVAQADELDALLGEFGRKVDAVILIDAPRDELLRRLTKRSAEQGRTDDTPAVIGRRLDVYKEQTQPVVDHYKRKALVHLVDGLGTRRRCDQAAAHGDGRMITLKTNDETAKMREAGLIVAEMLAACRAGRAAGGHHR